MGFASSTIEDLIARFEKSNPNVTATQRSTEPSYQVLAQELQAAIAAGEPPDVALVGYDVLRYTATSVPHLSAEDAARRDPDGRRWLDEGFAQNVLDLATVNGTLHFVPYSLSVPTLFFNKDAFEQVGLSSAPRTWDEVRDYARRLTEGTDLLALSVDEGEATFWMFQGIMESNGADVVVVESGDGVRCGVDGPEAIEATRFVAEMVLEEEIAEFVRGLGGDDFASGKIAMLMDSSGRLGTIQEGADFAYGAAPMPTFGDKPRRVPSGGAAMGVFAEDEPRQAAAWEFVKHFLSPEALTIWDKATGYLPPRREVAEDPEYLGSYYERNSAARATVEQLADAVPWASWPGENGLEATQELSDALDRIFSGGQDVAAVLSDAARRVNELIAG